MSDVFAIVVGGLLLVFGWTVVVPRHWRGDREHDQIFAAWLPVSAGTKRGMARAIPVVFLSFTCLVGSVIVAVIFTSMYGRVPKGILWVLASVTLADVFVLWPSVVFFNRPSFLVAPHYRAESGAVAMWRADRNKDKSQKEDRDD